MLHPHTPLTRPPPPPKRQISRPNKDRTNSFGESVMAITSSSRADLYCICGHLPPRISTHRLRKWNRSHKKNIFVLLSYPYSLCPFTDERFTDSLCISGFLFSAARRLGLVYSYHLFGNPWRILHSFTLFMRILGTRKVIAKNLSSQDYGAIHVNLWCDF